MNMLIQCTKKLADSFKIQLEMIPEQRDALFEWHAHIFMFERRKAILLMNNATRYPIILYGVKKDHLKNFDAVFKEAIKEVFLTQGINPIFVEKYLLDCGHFHFTKTDNRSLTGQINDFWIHISWEIEYHLESLSVHLTNLSLWAADIPCWKIKNSPNREMMQAIEERYGDMNLK